MKPPRPKNQFPPKTFLYIGTARVLYILYIQYTLPGYCTYCIYSIHCIHRIYYIYCIYSIYCTCSIYCIYIICSIYNIKCIYNLGHIFGQISVEHLIFAHVSARSVSKIWCRGNLRSQCRTYDPIGHVLALIPNWFGNYTKPIRQLYQTGLTTVPIWFGTSITKMRVHLRNQFLAWRTGYQTSLLLLSSLTPV